MLFNIKTKLMKYTEDTTRTAAAYNIEPRDVVFCQLIAAGADRGEAYFCIYDHGGKPGGRTLEQARTKANEFFNLNPGAAVLVQRIKTKKPLNTTEAKNQADAARKEKESDFFNNEDLKKFTDKSYIIAQLAQEAKNQSGKERANILMQIADLQRMKQEETKQDEEKRLFYLPFVSSCRSCKLVQLLRELSQQ